MGMMEEPPEMDRRNPFCHLLNAFLYQTHRSPKCPTLPVKEPDVLKAEGGYVYRSEKWDNFQTSSRKKGITQVKGQREQQTHFPGVFFFLSLLFYFFPSVSFKTETLNVLIRLFFFFSWALVQKHRDGPFCWSHGRVLPCREQDQFPARVTCSLGPWGQDLFCVSQ